MEKSKKELIAENRHLKSILYEIEHAIDVMEIKLIVQENLSKIKDKNKG